MNKYWNCLGLFYSSSDHCSNNNSTLTLICILKMAWDSQCLFLWKVFWYNKMKMLKSVSHDDKQPLTHQLDVKESPITVFQIVDECFYLF